MLRHNICKTATFAYHGVLNAAEGGPAILRLTVKPDRPGSSAGETRSIDYDRVVIAGVEYLLPVAVKFDVQISNREFHNESVYRDYRKFGAESNIKIEPDRERFRPCPSRAPVFMVAGAGKSQRQAAQDNLQGHACPTEIRMRRSLVSHATEDIVRASDLTRARCCKLLSNHSLRNHSLQFIRYRPLHGCVIPYHSSRHCENDSPSDLLWFIREHRTYTFKPFVHTVPVFLHTQSGLFEHFQEHKPLPRVQ